MNGIKAFFRKLHRQLFQINDSPQRIAIGFGLGVFTGIFPGMGPIAAVVMASFLRINKASSLIGSLLTNTWISVFTFILAAQIGGRIFSIPWEQVRDQWGSSAALKVLLPVLAGYIMIGLAAGLIGYVLVYMLLKMRKRR